MSCAAPTFESVFLESNPLEALRKAIGQLSLGESEQNAANSLLDKIQEIQDIFKILSQTEKQMFTGEMAENITSTVKRIKSKIVEKVVYDEVASFTFPIISMFLLISIFVVFGYKLYKSLLDKQKKRSQKVKAKPSKKRK